MFKQLPQPHEGILRFLQGQLQLQQGYQDQLHQFQLTLTGEVFMVRSKIQMKGKLFLETFNHQGKLILLIQQKNTSICLLMKMQYTVSALRQTGIQIKMLCLGKWPYFEYCYGDYKLLIYQRHLVYRPHTFSSLVPFQNQ